MTIQLANPAYVMMQAAIAVLKPPEDVDFLKWAEKEIIFSERETENAGRYNRKLFAPFDEIYDALMLQKVDIVLTAHPTEVNRRTLLRKYREISESLAQLDKKDLSPYEKSQCEEALRREIYSIWGSDEIRREKPTPQTEAKGEHLRL